MDDRDYESIAAELPDPVAEAQRLAADPDHRRRKAAWIRTQAEQRGRASNPALYDARMRRAAELETFT